jgi:PIN domain nuclease of toxin-antitoxin system
MAIKVGRGRLTLPRPVEEYVGSRVAATGVVELPVSATHAIRVAGLPDHHRDPFDRLLIAQSLVEGVPIITADLQLTAYDCEVLLVE